MTIEESKKRVLNVIHYENQPLFGAMCCILYLQPNISAKFIYNRLLQGSIIELSEMSILDYAESFEAIFTGNAIEFLRIYQDYFGPIE